MRASACTHRFPRDCRVNSSTCDRARPSAFAMKSASTTPALACSESTQHGTRSPVSHRETRAASASSSVAWVTNNSDSAMALSTPMLGASR